MPGVANQRKQTRFLPDPNTVTWFCEGHEKFEETYLGLTTSESHGGSGFIFVGEFSWPEGTKVFVKSGELAPLRAEIRWIKILGEKIYHIGLMNLE